MTVALPDLAALRAAGQLPPWLGLDPVHVSHRSSLLRKDPEHYRRFFPTEPDDLPIAAMAAEAAAEPEFRFLRPSQVDGAATGAGLVVLDGVERSEVPELGLPVLTLRTVRESG